MKKTCIDITIKEFKESDNNKNTSTTREYDRAEESTMTEAKFKIGDQFSRKNTIDEIPVEVSEIAYEFEPVYTLKKIRLCGNDVVLGEAALMDLYEKIN